MMAVMKEWILSLPLVEEQDQEEEVVVVEPPRGSWVAHLLMLTNWVEGEEVELGVEELGQTSSLVEVDHQEEERVEEEEGVGLHPLKERLSWEVGEGAWAEKVAGVG